jgi:ribosome maturation factor RimP
MNQALQAIIEAELDALKFDLVELRRVGTRTRPVLDVRIDRRDGQRVSIDDCARVSRAIEARLDSTDVVAGQYVLEVSSPGAERPLRTPADWRRFVGRKAHVKNPALDGGAADVELVAVEGEAGLEVAVVRDRKGIDHRMPISQVTDARLVLEWKA